MKKYIIAKWNRKASGFDYIKEPGFFWHSWTKNFLVAKKVSADRLPYNHTFHCLEVNDNLEEYLHFKSLHNSGNRTTELMLE